mgnify:CR=1 FL=1
MSCGVEVAVVMWELGALLHSLMATGAVVGGVGAGTLADDALADVGARTTGQVETGEVTMVGQTVDGRPVEIQRDEQGGYTVAPGVLTEEQQAQVKQQYALGKVTKEATDKGYAVAEQEVLPDQSIRVVLRKWG